MERKPHPVNAHGYRNPSRDCLHATDNLRQCQTIALALTSLNFCDAFFFSVPSNDFVIRFSVYYWDVATPIVLADLDAKAGLLGNHGFVKPFNGLNADPEVTKLFSKLESEQGKKIAYFSDQPVTFDDSVRDYLFTVNMPNSFCGHALQNVVCEG